MASLKDIKGRIDSVSVTQKVTDAMRMVATVKFRRAHRAAEAILPYLNSLQSIFTRFIEDSTTQAYLTNGRPEEKVAIVAVASDSGLCGSYNNNVIKILEETVAAHGCVEVYPIGKKVKDASRKMGLNIADTDPSLSRNPTYEAASALAAHLEKRYLAKEIDGVVLLYQHLRSTASTKVVCENFLPIQLDTDSKNSTAYDFIVEPDAGSVVGKLLPKLLSTKIYAVLCDAVASEHASRMIAMQTAGDNADKILGELRLQYNRLRQQTITNQLLDIIGGTMR